jgi:hypothetical protein
MTNGSGMRTAMIDRGGHRGHRPSPAYRCSVEDRDCFAGRVGRCRALDRPDGQSADATGRRVMSARIAIAIESVSKSAPKIAVFSTSGRTVVSIGDVNSGAGCR